MKNAKNKKNGKRKASLVFLLLALLSLAALSSGYPGEETLEIVRSEHEMRWLYDEWALTHDKSYSSKSEKEKRFEIFKENLLFIDNHNRPENNYTYTVGLNQFADLTDKEFRDLYLGATPINVSHPPANDISTHHRPEIGQHLPKSIDWRMRGAVCPVKNQGPCESCRAFAAVAAIEGLHQITTGNMIPLSEQELVDCDTSNQGCKAGHITGTYQYIIDNKGIDTYRHYPYRGVKGICRTDRKKVVTISEYARVQSRNATALQSAVARQPVSVWIEAYDKGFRFYKWGVFSGPCGVRGDHFVTVVGYGWELRGLYWILKNSWGRTWGEGGFMRIQGDIGGSGLCAILEYAHYPVMNRPLSVGKESE